MISSFKFLCSLIVTFYQLVLGSIHKQRLIPSVTFINSSIFATINPSGEQADDNRPIWIGLSGERMLDENELAQQAIEITSLSEAKRGQLSSMLKLLRNSATEDQEFCAAYEAFNLEGDRRLDLALAYGYLRSITWHDIIAQRQYYFKTWPMGISVNGLIDSVLVETMDQIICLAAIEKKTLIHCKMAPNQADHEGHPELAIFQDGQQDLVMADVEKLYRGETIEQMLESTGEWSKLGGFHLARRAYERLPTHGHWHGHKMASGYDVYVVAHEEDYNPTKTISLWPTIIRIRHNLNHSPILDDFGDDNEWEYVVAEKVPTQLDEARSFDDERSDAKRHIQHRLRDLFSFYNATRIITNRQPF